MEETVKNSNRELDFTSFKPNRSQEITRHSEDFVSAKSFEHRKSNQTKKSVNRVILATGLALVVALSLIHAAGELAPNSFLGKIDKALEETQDKNIEPRTGFSLPDDEDISLGGR